MNVIGEAAVEEVLHAELAWFDFERMKAGYLDDAFGNECLRTAHGAQPRRIEQERAEHAQELVVQNVYVHRAHQIGQVDWMHVVLAAVESGAFA